MQIRRRKNQRHLARLCKSTVEAVESRVLLSGSPTPLVYFTPTAKYTPIAQMHSVQPDSGGFSSPAGGTLPSQMRQAYGVSSISFGGTAGDGTGQTIAIIDAYDDPNAASDLTAFDAKFGLANPPSFTKLNQNGQTSPLPGTDPAGPNSVNNTTVGTWEEEESLDIEWTHVMAPKANIILYEANDNSSLYSAVTTANANSAVTVMSMSFGGGQYSGETSENSTYFNRSGITYLASTGDRGTPAGNPASLANVVAVGGTTMHQSSGNYSSETGWAGSGGGIDPNDPQPSYQAFTVKAKSTTNRTTPDVSIEADPNTGVPIYDSWDFGTSTPWVPGYEGGTSLSAPMWAGLVAVADQGRAINGLSSLSGITQTLPRLYQLPASNYHDITSGNNGLAAGTGYDLVTGIGSPIANLLVPDLAGNASITGRMFVDVDGNGTFGGSDTVMTGKTVYLDLNNDGVLDNNEPSTTTNSSGGYLFTDQPAGGTIRLSAPNQSGFVLTSAATASITYGSSEIVNFTYQEPSKLAFTTQPASTTYGTALSNIVVNIEALNGATIFGNSDVVTLTLNSGTFSSGLTTATATASNGVATFTGLRTNTVGSYTLTASDASLTTATSGSFAITRATPTVGWSAPASIVYGTALSGTQLDATASVPGTFVYSPADGTVLTVGASQTLHVTFTPTDSTDYANASGSTTITVTQATPTISWLTPASITYGTALSGIQLDATASVPGTFVYTPTAGTVLTAGTQNLSVVFNPTDTTDYKTANGSTSITVLKATPTIDWSNPASIPYGTALDGTQLDATASVPGTFAYNPSAGTVLSPGANQSLGVVFTPTDTTDYTTASDSVLITVTGTTTQPINLTGSSFYLKLDNASPQNLDIWTSATDSGAPAQVVQFNTISSISISATSNGDTFVADFSGGSIIPSGGLSFTGSGVAANNSLTIVGSGGSDSVTVPGDGTANINTQAVNYSPGTIGNVYFAPGGAGESLTIPSSTVTLAPGTGSGVTTSTFSSISIGAGAKLVIPTAANHANRTLVQTTSLTLAGNSSAWTSTVDLTNNDLDVTDGSFGDLSSQVAQGYTTGTTGILSSAGAADATHLTTLGIIQNTGGDVLVKYTYFGDANTNGTVDTVDYTLIDNGFLQHLTGWSNGDFNYDGTINGSDYTLIDNAFNTQGATLSAEIAGATSKAAVSSSAAVASNVATPATASNDFEELSNRKSNRLITWMFPAEEH